MFSTLSSIHQRSRDAAYASVQKCGEPVAENARSLLTQCQDKELELYTEIEKREMEGTYSEPGKTFISTGRILSRLVVDQDRIIKAQARLSNLINRVFDIGEGYPLRHPGYIVDNEIDRLWYSLAMSVLRNPDPRDRARQGKDILKHCESAQKYSRFLLRGGGDRIYQQVMEEAKSRAVKELGDERMRGRIAVIVSAIALKMVVPELEG